MTPVPAEAGRNINGAVGKMSNVLLSLLSAGLLILAFPGPDLGFLSWVALVPWFFALRKQKPKSAFFLSWLVGLIFFSGIIYWVNYVTSLGFTLLVLYLGLYFAVFGLVFSINSKQSTLKSLFLIPCLWVGLEYIRSHVFTGFGWALLGYSQYRYLPVIQISDITGAYGVSFLIVLVNAGIYYATGKSQVKKYRFLIPVFLLTALFLGYGWFKTGQQPGGKNIKVSVIQGNIPQVMKWDPDARDFILERYLQLTEEAASEQPELIIWPETSVPGYLENEKALLKKLKALSKKVSPSSLLLGTPHIDERKIFNSATLMSKGEVIKRYDKVHLVPFGEFVPLPRIFSRFAFASLIGGFTPGEEYTVFSLSDEKGDRLLFTEEPESKSSLSPFSVLICFEDVVAPLAGRFVRSGAQFLVNMTNDAWFGDSSEPRQHLQASVFRAVENRVNVVRSANTGISCFINPRGRILAEVSDASGRDVCVEGEKTQELTISSPASIYTRFGDVFAWVCLLMVALTIALWDLFPPNSLPNHGNWSKPQRKTRQG
jgi:apolipoprotein N-acyltransferase